MEQYISKSALVAEIERLKVHSEEAIQEFGREGYIDNVLFEQSKIRICEKLLSLLDTLEAKEVDVEEKATQLSQKYFPNEENIWARSNIEARKCKSACIEMVEWLKAQKGEEL